MSRPTLSALARDWADATPSPLQIAADEIRASGRELIDLVTPRAADTGIEFPPQLLSDIITEAMTARTVSHYAPDPLGQRPAREAIAEFYRQRGDSAEPDSICLVPGTSFGYFSAFRLLTNPGDEVLIPAPGYPLFDDLCVLAGVSPRRYHLTDRSGQWRPDLDDLAFQCTPRTRAVIVVSPHNPTGCVFSQSELDQLAAICRERNLALILDEVFSEFLYDPAAALSRPSGFPLSITLNGFSKMFALPGWKIAWMKVGGDPQLTQPFMAALAHLSDTFLPVSELAQAMVPSLLAAGAKVSRSFSKEYRRRIGIAVSSVRCPITTPEGGVYLCASLPRGTNDDEFALNLVRDHSLLVHPGRYYDLPHHFVFTCSVHEEQLRAGIERINTALVTRT